MTNRKTILTIIILLLLAGNVFFGAKYFAVKDQLRQTQAALETQTTNGKILRFNKLFISKVLRAKSEIDFETRLRLENTVRDLNDEEILTQWKKFTDSQTEVQSQEEVKNLLEMLANKIQAQ